MPSTFLANVDFPFYSIDIKLILNTFILSKRESLFKKFPSIHVNNRMDSIYYNKACKGSNRSWIKFGETLA